MGEIAPPASFRFANTGEYTRLTAQGLNTLYKEGVGGLKEFMSPPAIISTTGLVNAMESAAGIGIDKLVTQALPADVPSKIAHLVTDLLERAVGVAVDYISGEIVDAVGSALDVIPFLGQAVKILFGWFISAFTEEAKLKGELEESAEKKAISEARRLCSLWTQDARPVATSNLGVTPADMFRQVAYAAQSGTRLPMSTASIYVMLCGGETQGVGLTRTEYNQLLGRAQVHIGRGVGLPKDIQRKMWTLIKGIMSAVQDPSLRSDLTQIGDQGRSLMPLLQDIVWNHHIDVARGSSGWWNSKFIEYLSDALASKWTVRGHACGYVWGGAVDICRVVTKNCANYVELTDPFYKSIRSWQNILKDEYTDPVTGKWDLKKTLIRHNLINKVKPKIGLLTLNREKAIQLSKQVELAISGKSTSKKIFETALIASAVAGGGYSAWYGWNKYLRKP